MDNCIYLVNQDEIGYLVICARHTNVLKNLGNAVAEPIDGQSSCLLDDLTLFTYHVNTFLIQ